MSTMFNRVGEDFDRLVAGLNLTVVSEINDSGDEIGTGTGGPEFATGGKFAGFFEGGGPTYRRLAIRDNLLLAEIDESYYKPGYYSLWLTVVTGGKWFDLTVDSVIVL